MVSIFGSAIFLLGSDEDSADLSQQASDIQAQEAALQEAQSQSLACRGTEVSVSDDNKQIPEYDLPSGEITELRTVDLVEGNGAEAGEGACVVAYYHGTLTDGTVFDSSYERGQPLPFSLNGVIQGWTEGIPGMKEGGVRVLYIPSDLAYGASGNGPIGPNEDLVFVVELVEVVDL